MAPARAGIVVSYPSPTANHSDQICLITPVAEPWCLSAGALSWRHVPPPSRLVIRVWQRQQMPSNFIICDLLVLPARHVRAATAPEGRTVISVFLRLQGEPRQPRDSHLGV